MDAVGGDDDVADGELRRDATGRAGQQHALDAEVLDQQRRRRRDRGLADARDHRDHLAAVEDAAVEAAAQDALDLGLLEVDEHRIELLLHRREDPDRRLLCACHRVMIARGVDRWLAEGLWLAGSDDRRAGMRVDAVGRHDLDVAEARRGKRVA